MQSHQLCTICCGASTHKVPSSLTQHRSFPNRPGTRFIIRVAEEELPQLESLIALFDSSDAGQTGVVAVLPGGETVRAENAETLKFPDITIRKSTVLHGNISGYEELKITTDAMTRKTYFIYFLKAGDEQLLVQTVKSVFNWGNDLNYGVYRPAKAMIFYGLEPGMPQEIDVLVEKLDSQSPAANASQPTPPRQPGSIAAIEDSQPACASDRTERLSPARRMPTCGDLAELINILFSGWIESAIADPRTNSLLAAAPKNPMLEIEVVVLQHDSRLASREASPAGTDSSAGPELRLQKLRAALQQKLSRLEAGLEPAAVQCRPRK